MSRFRVTMTVVYDFDHVGDHPEAVKLAEEAMEAMVGARTVMRKQVRLEKLRERRCTIHLGEFQPEDVIPYITKEETKRDYKVGEKTYQVRMNSPRYFIFRESLKCVACGLEGTKMVLEQNPSDKSPHFNLYAVEGGRLVLMTKDHVQPKAYGGEDRHSNYQTMCSVCNNIKGSANLTLEGIQELRRIYNESRSLPKKKQRIVLEEAKKRLATAWTEKRVGKMGRRRVMAKRKSQETCVISNTDIHVLRLTDGSLVGRSIYEHQIPDAVHVACIKSGTVLIPTGSQQTKLILKLSDTEEFAVYQGYVEYPENFGVEEEADAQVDVPEPERQMGFPESGSPL